MEDLFDYFRTKPDKKPHEYYDFNVEITYQLDDSIRFECGAKPNSKYFELFPGSKIDKNYLRKEDIITIYSTYRENELVLTLYANNLLKYPYDSYFNGAWDSREEELKFIKGLPHFFFCNFIKYLLRENYIKSNSTILVSAVAHGGLRSKYGKEEAQERVIRNYESMGFKLTDSPNELRANLWDIVEKCVYKNRMEENLKINVTKKYSKDFTLSSIAREKALEIYEQCKLALKWLPGNNIEKILCLYLVATGAKDSTYFNLTKKQLIRLKESLEKVDDILIFIGDFFRIGHDTLFVINKSSEEDLVEKFEALLLDEISEEDREMYLKEVVGYGMKIGFGDDSLGYTITYSAILEDGSKIFLEKYFNISLDYPANYLLLYYMIMLRKINLECEMVTAGK